MPTLENDRLVFRFPQIEEDASLTIDFQRTLRIPDSDKTYPLPPGLGSFPLRHVEDHAESLSTATVSRGGVILPIWQAEAMWLSFGNNGPDWGLDFPVAIKVAAGKINAVTGDPWRSGLHRDPQDYMVSPDQPWLDGFAVEKGVIHQFVAMPLGDGYSVEEQLTGDAEWGGLQISVIPLKAQVWTARRRAWEARQRRSQESRASFSYCESAVPSACQSSMGLAAGGRMRQVIHPDSFDIEDWDVAAADRVFVSLMHAKDWKTITGQPAPNERPTAKDYSNAGLPWFEHYGQDQAALPGSAKLARVSSLAKLFKKKTGAALPNSQDIDTGTPKAIGPGAKGPRPVRISSSWEM
jgi:hypothetical protein